MSFDMSSTDTILESLKGQQVTIPSIYETFPKWEAKAHPDYEKARDEVLNPWIDRLVLLIFGGSS